VHRYHLGKPHAAKGDQVERAEAGGRADLDERVESETASHSLSRGRSGEPEPLAR
jgi:hypothetical protein